MNWLSGLAACGVWPAVPLTGYLLFTHNRTGLDVQRFPLCVSAALMTVAGLAVWSSVLLGAVIAGVYRGEYLGALGWTVTLFGLGAVLRFRRKRQSPENRGENTDDTDLLRNQHREVRPGEVLAHSNRAGRRAQRAKLRSVLTASDSTAAGLQVSEGWSPSHTGVTTSSWNGVLAAGLLLAAGLYLGFPTESIYGERDEGVYATHAMYIAQHGCLDVPYPWPEDLRATLAGAWIGFSGFYTTPAAMTPQFGHLLTVWLAQAFASFGHHGLFRLNAVFTCLSLTVFYGFCLMVMPPSYAVLATLFLAFNPSQLWMARITLSEILTQLLTWSGLLLLLQAMRHADKSAGYWAGLCFGLSAFVRIDGLVLAPLLLLARAALRILGARNERAEGDGQTVTAAGIGRRDSSVPWSAVYRTAFPMCALALGYYLLFSTPYFHHIANQIAREYSVELIGGTAVFLLVLLAATPSIAKRVGPWLASTSALGVAGAAIVALATYAYWIRPLHAAAAKGRFVWPGYYFDAARDYGRDSLINLAQYLSPPVIWLAIAGWLLVIWRVARQDRDSYLVPAVVVIGATSVLYLWHPGLEPDHFWTIRRFVPIVIPGFIFCAAVGAHAILTRIPKPWSFAVAAVAVAFLVFFTVQAGSPIFTFAEDLGYFSQVEALARKLPTDELIFAHGHRANLTPLYIAFDRKVIPVRNAQGRRAWETWVAKQASQHRPAYFLAEEQSSISGTAFARKERLDLRGLPAVTIDEAVISRSFSEPTVSPLPKRILTDKRTVRLYKVVSPGSN